MATVKVVPRSLTEAYKRGEGDFSPNLVGFQFTDGVSLFTFGNFQITSNFDGKVTKDFTLGGQWSDYYSLNNLNLTPSQSATLLSNDIFVRLNFDINKIGRYVYFGSFHEFSRVTLEQIIQKWKGSIFVSPTLNTNIVNNTVLSFSYDSGNDEADFLIPANIVSNPYELIISDNQNFNNLLPSDIFNLSRDYNKYVISVNNRNYSVIDYTGSTNTFPYLRITTKGNPFPSLTASTFGQFTYHMKPNDTEVEQFFLQLDDFEKILLNRLTTPIYTSSFNVPQEVDGFTIFNDVKLTWPITDGYNLDINTPAYTTYVENLLDMSLNFDLNKTDLVARRFVSESIREYDTDGGGNEIYGRKVDKLLRIYGREFDQVKKYIDGISFANVVTYNKLDNTSDELIKIIAKSLGFDILLTVGTDNFNLIEQTQPSFQTPFSGYSRSLSSKELDIELWRRLVINAWWLFKSKGTRKVIEFFFKLFNIPTCMISLDEYIYLAENKLNPNQVFLELQKIFDLTGISNTVTSITPNLNSYPIDIYGFPKILPETNNNYFQMNGFWYNGGNESTVGNNPHIGEYDYGKSYFNQFECFVSNFNDLLTGSTLVTVNRNYFNNYNEGTFIFDQNGLPVPFYGDGYGSILNNQGTTQNVSIGSAGLIYLGGNNSPNYGRPSGDTYSMKVSFTAGTKQICEPCNYEFTYGDDGIVYIKGETNTTLIPKKCCQNYWLPSQTDNPVTVCPDVSQVAIVSPTDLIQPCVIIDKSNKTIPRSCCNKTTLGFDVIWDGTNCVDINCFNSIGGSIEIFTGGTLLEEAKGFELINTPIIDLEFKNHTCYWCPPDTFIKIVCSVNEYLTLLTILEIEQLATNLGWGGIINPMCF